MDIYLSLAGLVITIASLIYAIMTSRERVKLERLVEAKLWGIQTTITKIRNNPQLAHKHLDELRRYLNRLPHSDNLQVPLDQVAWAQADSSATDRMLEQLSDDVDSLRVSLFQKLSETRTSRAPQ